MHELKQVRSPRGNPTWVVVRDGTSDLSCIYSTFEYQDDEYRLAGRFISGWAIDIGAHLGTIGLAVLADNPTARVIFVEPLAPNITSIVAGLHANGWDERAIVIHGAIAPGETASIAFDYSTTDYGRTNRYIGNLSEQAADEACSSETVKAFTFAQIVAMADGPIEFVKWDCEGCEWFGLRDAGDCAAMVGEYHGDPQQEGIVERLSGTHDVTFRDVHIPNGIFEAVRR